MSSMYCLVVLTSAIAGECYSNLFCKLLIQMSCINSYARNAVKKLMINLLALCCKHRTHRHILAEEIKIFDLLINRRCISLASVFAAVFSSQTRGLWEGEHFTQADLLNTTGTQELEEPSYLNYCLCNSRESYLELLDFILSKGIYSYIDFQFHNVFRNRNESWITWK